MKIFTTKDVTEGAQINYIYKHKEDWFATTTETAFSADEKPIDEVYEVTEQYLLSRIPKLTGQLDQPDKTIINIDYATGEVNINKQHRHIGISGHYARASRQANIKLNFFHYLSLRKGKLFKTLAIAAVLFLASFFIHWIFYLGFAGYVVINLLTIFATKNGHLSGDLGPAIVIDAENSKIAALSDMSLRGGAFPILRVIQIPLPDKYKKNGQRLAVAGVFQNTHKYDHWNFYLPRPVVSATNDEAVIKESYDRIPNNEWVKLELEIKQFEEIPLEGYYPIDIETTEWQYKENLEDIHWNNFGKEKANLTPAMRERQKDREKFEESKKEFKNSWKTLKSDLKEIKDDTIKEIKESNKKIDEEYAEKKKKINKRFGKK